MVEIGNKLLEDVLRKAEGDWKKNVSKSVRFINPRIIEHLGVSPMKILVGRNVVSTHLDSDI